MTLTWEELVAFASALPETAESTSHGTPALKVKGKLVARYDGHGYVLVDLERADTDQLLELLDAAWWLVAPVRGRQARERTT